MRIASVLSLCAVSLAAADVAAQDAKQSAAARPNIIVIVADDLGYGELGCYGGKEVPTPSIDSIARQGVRFTDGYVTHPVCAPTRAALLSGRYQQRFGFEFNPGPEAQASEQFGLPTTEKTLAERLKESGYRTGMVGKWHLGFREELQPPKRGFEEFFGFLGGGHAYQPAQRGGQILRGTTRVREEAYLTDAFGREAVAFIDRHKAEPFFLYLAFNAVHAPLQAKESDTAKFSSIQDEKRRTFAAMLASLDENVGAVLKKVREEGLEERTLIFFISDNGGPTRQTTSGNGPLRGFKGQVFDGGIRVPYMLQWKGKVPGGTEFRMPVISLDIVPTALAAAGVKPADADKLEGADLVPFVTGKSTGRPHEGLFWRAGQQSAARVGDYKLVVQPNAAPMLFDLSKDIGEQTDLAASQPDKLREVQAAYETWNKQNIAPKWRAAPRRRNANQQGNPGKP